MGVGLPAGPKVWLPVYRPKNSRTLILYGSFSPCFELPTGFLSGQVTAPASSYSGEEDSDEIPSEVLKPHLRFQLDHSGQAPDHRSRFAGEGRLRLAYTAVFHHSQQDWAFDSGAYTVRFLNLFLVSHRSDGDPEVGPVGFSSERWVSSIVRSGYRSDCTFTGATRTVWRLGRVLS